MHLILALALGLLACAELEPPGPPPFLQEPAAEEKEEERQALWTIFSDQGSIFVKAGTQQELALGSAITLLGPPIAQTDHRQVVGSAQVTEVWEDLAEVALLDLSEEVTDESQLVARLQEPEDQELLKSIPKAEGGAAIGTQPKAAVSAVAVPAPSAGGGASASASASASAQVSIPADLRTGTAAERIDALLRYEDDPGASAAVVWVMKNDEDASVRKKAWRVVRARWRRGTGSDATHRAAAIWLAAHGTSGLRVEALNAIGKRCSDTSLVSPYLADGSSRIRIEAGDALADMGRLTSQQSKARSLITARLEVESDPKVRAELADALEAL